MGGCFLQSIFAYLQLACHSCEGREQWAAGCRGWWKSGAALNASPRRLHWIRWTQAALTAWLQGDQCFCYPLWCWHWFFFFMFPTCIYFKECPQVGCIPQNMQNYPMNVKCVFPPKCVRLKTLSSRIRKFWMRFWFHIFLAVCPWARSLTTLRLTFLICWVGLLCLPHPIIDGSKGNRLSTGPTSQ